MKVLWLFPPSPEGGFPNISQYRFFKYMPVRSSIIYPYLAASGVTQLIQNGFEVCFMDCPTKEFTWNHIHLEARDSDIVIMEARTPIMQHIWKTAADLKTFNPGLKIILYGDHVCHFPMESLEKPGVDFIVNSGDWDAGVVQLCKDLRAGKEPSKNYVFPLLKDLNLLPWVNRESVNWRDYYEAWRNRDNFFWVMSGRGCFYDCTFCAWVKTFWNNSIRLRDPTDVAKEFQFLVKLYGDIEVLDDNDLFITEWGKKFSHKLMDLDLGNKTVLWAFQTHPNEIYGLENFRFMHKAGLQTVKLGIESLNQKTLDLMRKKTTVKQIGKAIQILKEAKIMVHANLIVGWPWETKQDAENTIKIIKKLDPNQAQFSMLIPYPNTELYEMAIQNDWLTVEPGDWNAFNAVHPMLKMEGLSPNEVVDLYRQHWSSFYLNRKYIWQHIKKVKHFSGILQLYRGFKSIYFGHMKAMKKRNKE